MDATLRAVASPIIRIRRLCSEKYGIQHHFSVICIVLAAVLYRIIITDGTSGTARFKHEHLRQPERMPCPYACVHALEHEKWWTRGRC